MSGLVARFQTNDKPWSDPVLPQDYAAEFSRRLRVFLGPFHLREQGETFGPYLRRSEAIHRAVTKLTGEKEGYQVWVANKADKGVRARVVEVANPYGRIYHTTGKCKDNYDNIITDHNAAGQLVTLQEPAMLAYHEAERMNGKPIRITGVGLRTCKSQTALYVAWERAHPNGPHRYANPDESRHCRGLALDIFNTPDNLTPKAKACLENVGWNFAVSGEPWHCSFVEEG